MSSIITVPIGKAKFVYEMHRKVLLHEQMHKKESVGKLRVVARRLQPEWMDGPEVEPEK